MVKRTPKEHASTNPRTGPPTRRQKSFFKGVSEKKKKKKGGTRPFKSPTEKTSNMGTQKGESCHQSREGKRSHDTEKVSPGKIKNGAKEQSKANISSRKGPPGKDQKNHQKIVEGKVFTKRKRPRPQGNTEKAQ